jgi:hypothetical protein
MLQTTFSNNFLSGKSTHYLTLIIFWLPTSIVVPNNVVDANVLKKEKNSYLDTKTQFLEFRLNMI